MRIQLYKLILTLALTISILALISHARPSETERVESWYKRGNVWPPKWNEETEEFQQKQLAREVEIMTIPGSDERWENWMQFTQYQLVPKFTKQGFNIIKAPENVYRKLRAVIDEALLDWENIPYEGLTGAIYGPLDPKFVPLGQLAWDVIEELKPLHEEWGGLKLRATSSYGVRLYQNGSSLSMHCDKVETHVISSIIHIAHEYDDPSEPWPIEIEDHNGKLHSAILKEGEMLFYESARCLHGRITPLKGKYYGSLFVHYQPVDISIWPYTTETVIENVPPHWRDGVLEDYGSRWAGQAITVDSVIAAGAPPRYLGVDPRTRDPKSGLWEGDFGDEESEEF